MTTRTSVRVPAPSLLHDRAVAALRARDEAAARAEYAHRAGALPNDSFPATSAARVALADLLGMHDHSLVFIMHAPCGTLVLTLADPAHRGAAVAFLAERTHPTADHSSDAPAFRFHVMAPCPDCLHLIPVREIHELADLGEHFEPRRPDEYAHIGLDVSAPSALDPTWHASHCGLLLACHD